MELRVTDVGVKINALQALSPDKFLRETIARYVKVR
jgi:hypothetical protein